MRPCFSSIRGLVLVFSLMPISAFAGDRLICREVGSDLQIRDNTGESGWGNQMEVELQGVRQIGPSDPGTFPGEGTRPGSNLPRKPLGNFATEEGSPGESLNMPLWHQGWLKMAGQSSPKKYEKIDIRIKGSNRNKQDYLKIEGDPRLATQRYRNLSEHFDYVWFKAKISMKLTLQDRVIERSNSSALCRVKFDLEYATMERTPDEMRRIGAITGRAWKHIPTLDQPRPNPKWRSSVSESR